MSSNGDENDHCYQDVNVMIIRWMEIPQVTRKLFQSTRKWKKQEMEMLMDGMADKELECTLAILSLFQ